MEEMCQDYRGENSVLKQELQELQVGFGFLIENVVFQ